MSAVQKSYVVYRETYPGNWEEEGRFAEWANAEAKLRETQQTYPNDASDVVEEFE